MPASTTWKSRNRSGSSGGLWAVGRMIIRDSVTLDCNRRWNRRGGTSRTEWLTAYGAFETAASPITPQQLAELKASAGMTAEDERYLRRAGEVLADQTAEVVEH